LVINGSLSSHGRRQHAADVREVLRLGHFGVVAVDRVVLDDAGDVRAPARGHLGRLGPTLGRGEEQQVAIEHAGFEVGEQPRVVGLHREDRLELSLPKQGRVGMLAQVGRRVAVRRSVLREGVEQRQQIHPLPFLLEPGGQRMGDVAAE
jgi:hypothetical protein